MKSEPSECSIDDLLNAPNATVPWTGVRNYQARNFMRDSMQVDDGVLFYHSSCPEPGIAGIARVSRNAYPDETQFDPNSVYFDAKATREKPRWVHVDIQGLRKTKLISISEIRTHKALADMIVLRRGNRLSITPITPKEWHYMTRVLLNGTQS